MSKAYVPSINTFDVLVQEIDQFPVGGVQASLPVGGDVIIVQIIVGLVRANEDQSESA